MKLARAALCFSVSCALIFAAVTTWAQIPQNTYQELHWRMIGPYRGGRTRAAAGVPSQPNVFYMAQVNGGVWKTNDFGRTWNPIFDDQPTQSIGAIAIAPSDPNVVYVASGEGLHRPDCPLATESTSRPMRVRPGHISASETDNRFLLSP